MWHNRGMICPLCGAAADRFHHSQERDFFLCPLCQYIFVPSCHHLAPDDEKKRYLEHENSLSNEGYVRMFEDKLDLLAQYGTKSGDILDFGCGYEPVLKTLIERRGYSASVYDRFFFPEWDNTKLFDAVISTETFEHLRCPAIEIDRILGALKPEGCLAIMTHFYPETNGEPDLEGFADWYYKNDPTHIGFYGSGPVNWLSRNRNMEIIYKNEKDFVLFRTS